MREIFNSKWFSLVCAVLNGMFAVSAFMQGSYIFTIFCGCLCAYCLSNYLYAE